MTAATVRFDPRFESVAPPTLADALARQATLMCIAPAVAASRDPQPDEDAAGSPVSRDRVEAQLARILASRVFRHSLRHRKFLRYVVDGTLAGRARSLKEVVIGLDVFGRSLDGFDPKRDSIVRVEARRLRAKLSRYYATEGCDDDVEIGLLIGRYATTFSERVATRTSPRPASRAGAPAPLVMVLPLRTPGDVGVRGWSIGLADQLIARLGATALVRVMAPLATTNIEDPALVDRLRRDHAVDYVVDGSLARAGSRMRCTMFLSQTVDHLCVWSQTSEFDMASPDESDILFRVQDQVADAVATAVRGVVAPH